MSACVREHVRACIHAFQRAHNSGSAVWWAARRLSGWSDSRHYRRVCSVYMRVYMCVCSVCAGVLACICLSVRPSVSQGVRACEGLDTCFDWVIHTALLVLKHMSAPNAMHISMSSCFGGVTFLWAKEIQALYTVTIEYTAQNALPFCRNASCLYLKCLTQKRTATSTCFEQVLSGQDGFHTVELLCSKLHMHCL